MSELFDIERFNIISDNENYYFFRALNRADNKDLQEGIITDESGKYIKIRTDRERTEELLGGRKTKYSKDEPLTLEQIYDHIKINYSKETNCISLSSNANVSILYGRGSYTDKYIMVIVPKDEMGKSVVFAGQYMLQEIKKKIDETVQSYQIDEKVRKTLEKIDSAKNSAEIKQFIKARYTAKKSAETKQIIKSRDMAKKSAEIKQIIKARHTAKKSGIKKDIRAPEARISDYQSLSEEQSLQKNKIIGKLTLLEKIGLMKPIIPNTINNNLLVQTIGSAFASCEEIHYGEIKGERIVEVQKEIMDMFALIQQLENQDEQIMQELKEEIVNFIKHGRKIEIDLTEILNKDISVMDELNIDKIYDLVQGKLEYEKAKTMFLKIFYLTKSQVIAKQLAINLKQIVGENPKYQNIIEEIAQNGFGITKYGTAKQNITNIKNHKGIKLSESVNLELNDDEIDLVEIIKGLSKEQQKEILSNGVNSCVAKTIIDPITNNRREKKKDLD